MIKILLIIMIIMTVIINIGMKKAECSLHAYKQELQNQVIYMMAMWIFKHWRRTGRYKDEVKGEETSKLLLTRTFQLLLARP